MKKTNYSIALMIALCLVFASCKKTTSEIKQTSPNFTKSQEAILNSSNQFGLNIFKDLESGSSDDQNLFISPLSISMALTMTYNGAANQTATDMQNTLGFANLSRDSINKSCKELMQIILNLDPKVAMEIANSIWYRNTFSVKEDFLTLNKTYFDADVRACDFSDPQTVNLINGWVSTKTHGKISSVLKEIPDNIVMYLINAIYFKGAWTYRFETKNTLKATFNLTDGSSYETDFMSIRNKFRYFKNELLSAVELPYGNGDFSMLAILPKEGKTYHDVISALTPGNWSQWNSSLDSTDVLVMLPKLKFSYGKDISDNLKNLGMSSAFDPNHADFSGISETAKLFISFVLHKSFVEVNEEGTEATAVTVVGVNLTSIGPGESSYEIFNANKPFVFAIKENTTNSILFMGLVKKPVVE